MSFKKSTHMIYWGGGIGLACALLEGGWPNACTCVQRGGGGQKRPKNCVRTIWTAPNVGASFLKNWVQVNDVTTLGKRRKYVIFAFGFLKTETYACVV